MVCEENEKLRKEIQKTRKETKPTMVSSNKKMTIDSSKKMGHAEKVKENLRIKIIPSDIVIAVETKNKQNRE